MKAKDFFDKLRMYPDLDVDIYFKDGSSLYDIEDIQADDDKGTLFIVPMEV